MESNVVKVLYTKKDNLSYRIEYYFDGKIDSSKTSVINSQIFGTDIDNLNFPSYNNYEIKEVKNYPLIVSDKEEENVIKVYYTIKEGVVLPPKTLVDDYSSYFVALTLIVLCSSIILVKKYNCVKLFKK